MGFDKRVNAKSYLPQEATPCGLPGVAIVKRTTDGAGKVRISGIDPGVCGIRGILAETGLEVTKVMWR